MTAPARPTSEQPSVEELRRAAHDACACDAGGSHDPEMEFTDGIYYHRWYDDKKRCHVCEDAHPSIDALADRLAAVQGALDFIRNEWSPYSARGCPACVYENGVFKRSCKIHEALAAETKAREEAEANPSIGFSRTVARALERAEKAERDLQIERALREEQQRIAGGWCEQAREAEREVERLTAVIRYTLDEWFEPHYGNNDVGMAALVRDKLRAALRGAKETK